MTDHSHHKVGPYDVEGYTDKKTGDTNVVTKPNPDNKSPADLPRDPHTHEAHDPSGNLKHADITNKDGSKNEKVTENKSFWLQDSK